MIIFLRDFAKLSTEWCRKDRIFLWLYITAPNPSTALTSMLSTYPAKPALVAVFPTKGLEEEMVHGLLLSFIDI